MSKRLVMTVVVVLVGMLVCVPVEAQRGGQGRASMGGVGYREGAEFVIRNLGLRPNSVVVDIGAGDGWWSSKMAEKMGPKGVVHAGEVEQRKVDSMKTKWENVPQIKPYLCPMDGTGLEENSCDLAYISKTYHHLDKDGRVEYLKGLLKVIKPTGRLVIVERHSALASGRGAEHGGYPGVIAGQAEEAGWMTVKVVMIPNSDHFMAIFAQPEGFSKLLDRRIAAAKKKQAEAK